MVRVLVNVPKTVPRGEPFEVKVIISHPMESGQRRSADGQAVPRSIINTFTCSLNGEEVMTLDLFPAISANPFFAFTAVAQDSGTLILSWIDDDGTVGTHLADVTVT